jgi:hypothetical protein
MTNQTNNCCVVTIRVKVTLRLAGYRQSGRLGNKPLEVTTRFFFQLKTSHSQVRVPRDSWPYFTVLDSRLPQPGGPSPRIYIPQEQGGPVIPPGTGFPFRRLLRLAYKTRFFYCFVGVRCRGNVFTEPLHRNGLYNPVVLLLPKCMLRALSSNGRYLQSHCLATGLRQQGDLKGLLLFFKKRKVG